MRSAGAGDIRSESIGGLRFHFTLDRTFALDQGGAVLADAEPFLQAADQITVVTVDAQFDGYGEGPGRDICTYLAHKGFSVELRNVDGMGRQAEVALMNEARALDADLIVMGGYGHSRLREFVFGGVTRAMSRSATTPVLMSH